MTIETQDANGNSESSSPKSETAKVKRKDSSLRNPHLDGMSEDILYHLALSTTSHDLEEMFEDVKFVCVGGTAQRMLKFANFICEELGLELPVDQRPYDICERSQRYTMYKAGPVLCVSHGIGSPSISIMLHEVIKLLHHANATDVTFLRLGTCGGIGLEPGTVAITSSAVNGLLEPYQEMAILGRIVRRPSILDEELVNELKEIAQEHLKDCATVVGKTMCADDFYEGQGRLDGAFCEFTHQEKMNYMQQLRDNDIINIEMESVAFAAICANAGIKAGVICVALLDRLQSDQVTASVDVLEMWQQRVLKLVAIFIKKHLEKLRDI